jgi:pilus assembly protein FimV
MAGVPSEPAHSLFAETGGQSVDTNNSVFNSSFAPSASQLDTNEVDPVAEADVYIAYGRDAQAEEILKEALRTHPDRMPVRLKLLEIYAARKDQRAFETQAREVYGQTRGHGDDWAQAAALGLSIDPLNTLYANSAAPAGHVPSSEEIGQQVLLSKELNDAYAAPADDETVHAREPLSFDQHFADAMATAQPAPEPVTNAPARTEDGNDNDNALDFDLGGLSFEPVSPQEPAEPARADANDLEFDMSDFAPAAPAKAAASTPAAEDKADDPLDFAFDMDFDAPPKAAAVSEPAQAVHVEDDPLFDLGFDTPAAPAAPTPAAPAPAAPNNDIDFADLAKEFDLPELPTQRPAEPEQANAAEAADTTRAANELNDPLFDLDTMDFGLEEEPVRAEPAPTLASNPSPAFDDALFDLSHLPNEHPESLPTATPAPAGARFAEADKVEPNFDISTLDLDLPGDGALPLPEVHSLSGEGEGGTLSAVHMEMETKLDLAIAYQEIGDKEGARELLEEVIRGGSDEQVTRANTLRAALA